MTSAPARTDAAPAKVDPTTAVAHVIRRHKAIIAKLLANTGTTEETFIAQVANACRIQPKLWTCEPETVLGAALRCAQLALPPNDGNNLAWIIPYGKVATFQLGYGGVMELARRARPGLEFEGRPVYPNDIFDVDYGRVDQPLKHVPAVSRRRKDRSRGGPAFAWYVMVTYPDGRRHVHVIDREQVEYHRSFSKQPDGEMWSKSYDAAALKSCVLDMKRWLPVSRQLAEATASDEQVFDVRDMDQAGDITPPTAELGQPDTDDQADAAWVAEAQADG